MSLSLELIQKTTEQSSSYLVNRAGLNLPSYQSNIPLSSLQQEALDLVISDSPIAMISGNPGSGKTRVGYLAFSMAVHYQKSVLLVAHHVNTLASYQKLPLQPLILDQNMNYGKAASLWLRYQMSEPKIDFLPPYLLADSLIKKLQNQPNFGHLLTLAVSDEKMQLKKELEVIFPETSKHRLELLIFYLEEYFTLIKQRLLLLNQYKTLSDQAIAQLIKITIETTSIPILSTINNVLKTELELKKFDLIMVEDCHLLSESSLMVLASMTNKLALIGELTNNHSYFSNLSKSLSPAYQVNLSENFRLNPSLAYLIFPFYYHNYPYSLLGQYKSFINRLCWFDIRSGSILITQLFSYIDRLDSGLSLGIIVFSDSTKQVLQLQCPKQWKNNIIIDSVDNWIGRECDVILIVCDGSQPSYGQLCCALTRAKEMIACFGDKNQYEQSEFSPLFKADNFYVEREVL